MARQDGKTEKATPRKRREARREGTIARSQEVGVAFSLLAFMLSVQLFVPAGVGAMRDRTAWLLANSGTFRELPVGTIRAAIPDLAGVVVPLLAASVIAAVAAGLVQVGFVVAGKAATPKMKNLNPKRGLQKFKPATALWELVRSVLKLGLLALIMRGPVMEWMEVVGRNRSFAAALTHTHAQMFAILWRATLLAVVIAAADYAWNRWRTDKQLRMSKHDVKQEHKQLEGDPMMKAQRKRRAQEYSRNRMLRDVATADVVVTNPTHLAVALRYEPGAAAPTVVAKGADRLAAKIRKIAYRNGVVVTEDKPLARALFRRCKIGQQVPANLFEAVAIVLATAYRRRPGGLRRLQAVLGTEGARA